MGRIGWLDAAKGIGILLVVLGHTESLPPAVTTYIFSFHMPLFFFLSGYLFRPGGSGFRAFVRKKAKSLLVPYFAFAFLSYAFWLAAGRKFGADAGLDIPPWEPLLGIFYSNGHGRWLVFNTPLWFLTCLFVVEIGFFVLASRVRRPAVLAFALAVCAVAGYLDSSYMPFRLPWSFDVALSAIVFYGAGHLARRSVDRLRPRLRSMPSNPIRLSACAVLLLTGYAAAAANGRVDMNLHQYGNFFYYYMAAFAGAAGWILVSGFLSGLRPLRFLGENTLVVMASHLILLSLLKAVVLLILQVPREDTLTAFGSVMYAAGVTAAAIPAIHIFNRYLPFLLGKAMGGGKSGSKGGDAVSAIEVQQAGGIGMNKEANRIHVRNVTVSEGGTVRYSVQYGADVSRYFSGETFYVQYDRDMRQVPRGILMIPLLANLCPVAWIAGADVYVDELDKDFRDSLDKAKAAFAAMYPRIKFSGELRAGRLTEDAPAAEPNRTAAFFSGGVDSLGTFLRRKDENPYLITIWGGDIGLHQAHIWREVKRSNEAFAQMHGMESLFLKSNLRGFLNEELIAFNFGRFTHGWWPGVQHGIGMVGLCAPLAYALGIRHLHVPSALPPKLSRAVPDGSNTTVNNQLRWAGATVALEGEEITRQDKVALIADYIRGTGRKLTVRVCWSHKQFGNCGRCEKCSRTIAGLLAEGVDPAMAGFPPAADALDPIRQQLPKWLGAGSALRVEYWDEIRMRSIRNDAAIRPEDRAFFDWFRKLDLPSMGGKRSVKQALLDLIPHPLFLYLKRKTM